jgi:hypothetical protein
MTRPSAYRRTHTPHIDENSERIFAFFAVNYFGVETAVRERGNGAKAICDFARQRPHGSSGGHFGESPIGVGRTEVYNCGPQTDLPMNVTCEPNFLSRPMTDEALFQLQLQVAQRADELARVSPSGGSARRDRETWDRAEGELLTATPTKVVRGFGNRPAR